MDGIRCFIFGGGEESRCIPQILPGDLVIAADSGLKYARELELDVDLVIGDFDSLEADGWIEENMIRLEAEKDYTDMYIAAETAFLRGYRSFHLFGSCGGRLDHTLANISLAVSLTRKGCSVVLYGAGYNIEVLLNNMMRRFYDGMRGTISLFSMSEVCQGVIVRGLKYPLYDATLTFDVAMGISNEFTGRKSDVSLRYGTLLLVYDTAGLEFAL